MSHGFARSFSSRRNPGISVRRRSNHGYSLIEMLVGTLIGITVLAGGVALLRQSLTVNSLMGSRVEMQQNVRVAVNLVSRDLSLAGAGLFPGGIQLPSGDNSNDSRFCCGDEGCYVANNTYVGDRLHFISPADSLGPVVQGNATDMVTTAYRDPESQLDNWQLAFVSPGGDQIRFPSAAAAETAKIERGDALVLCNGIGCAVGVVTGTSGANVELAAGDPLGFNQPNAEFGNIKALEDPANPGTYPPTRAYRILIVTYFVDATDQRVMRQVNAHKAWPVAENVEDLQLDFDIVNPVSGVAQAALPDAGGSPNQIRKVNIQIQARGPHRSLFSNKYQRVSLSTSVSPRNLAFRDRYQ